MSRRTKLLLGCMGDVGRARVALARAWRCVRRPVVGGSMEARRLRRSMLRLDGALKVLDLAWACCVTAEA